VGRGLELAQQGSQRVVGIGEHPTMTLFGLGFGVELLNRYGSFSMLAVSA
jgi:hypothetical protein